MNSNKNGTLFRKIARVLLNLVSLFWGVLRLSISRECCSGSMKCILWSETIYKNTWEEQDYIVILQIYLLINLLNHRVNIIFRERFF